MHTHVHNTAHALTALHAFCYFDKTCFCGFVFMPVPKSRSELKAAVKACVSKSNTQAFDCRKYGNDLHTPIGEWDVSGVTDMADLFRDIKSFNSDISKWDVSRVTNMQSMFSNAQSFNADISKWDVSSVKDMQNMFKGAASFSRTLCGSGWIVSQAPKHYTMFTGSSAQICFGSQPYTVPSPTQPLAHLSTH